MPLIIIQEAGRSRKSFQLSNTETIIGRTSDCDVRINDTKSSRQHLKIYLQGSHYYAEDLKSSNGTLFNNDPLTTATLLKFGDELKIGLTSINFVQTDDAVAKDPFFLTIYLGQEDERKEKFDSDSLLIGRLTSNDLCITGKGISGKHAELKRVGNVLTIIDLESRNGIRINGKPKKKATLLVGDTIEIGTAKIRLESSELSKEKTPNEREKTIRVEKKEMELQEISLEETPKTELETLTENFSSLQEQRTLKAKGSKAIVVLVLLLFTVGMPLIGSFWIFQLLKEEKQRVPQVSVPGNLLEGNYSFEYIASQKNGSEKATSQVVDWHFSKDLSVSFTVDSFEGQYALEFPVCNQAESFRTAIYQKLYPAEKSYELSGTIKQIGNYGLAGLVVIYQTTKNKGFRQFEFSPFLNEKDQEYQTIRFAFKPPQGIDSFQIGVMSYGKSKQLLFDQIVLKETEAKEETQPLLEKNSFRLFRNQQGLLQLFFKEQLILDKISLNVELEGRFLQQKFATFESFESTGSEQYLLKGKFFDSVKNSWFPFEGKINTTNGLKFQFQLGQKTSGIISCSFETDPFFFDEHLLVVKETATFPFLRDKSETAAIGLVVSSVHRFGVHFRPGTITWKKERGQALFLYEQPKGENSTLEIEFSLLNKSGRQDVKDRLQAAKAAENKENFGQAIHLYNAILTEFPFTTESKLVEGELARLEKQASILLKEVETQVKRAAFFKQVQYLEHALELCQKLIQSYEGTRFSQFGQKVEKEMQILLQEAIALEASESGNHLLKRAEDLAKVGYPSIAKAFYETVLNAWSKTKEGQKAKEQLTQLSETK